MPRNSYRAKHIMYTVYAVLRESFVGAVGVAMYLIGVIGTYIGVQYRVNEGLKTEGLLSYYHPANKCNTKQH